jgi:hypothetical protein
MLNARHFGRQMQGAFEPPSLILRGFSVLTTRRFPSEIWGDTCIEIAKRVAFDTFDTFLTTTSERA